MRAFKGKRFSGFRRSFARSGMGRSTRMKRFSKKSPISNRSFAPWTAPTISRNNYVTFNKVPFKTSEFAVLQWADLERAPTTTVAGVGSNEFIYKLNDVYDPYLGASLINNPEYLTTFQALYFRMIVYKVDVQVEFSHPTQSTQVGVALLQCSSGTQTTLQAYDYLASKRDINIVNMSQGGASANVPLNFSVNLWELEGLTFDQYMSDMTDYSAAVNGSPTKSPYLRIGTNDPDGNSGASVKTKVRLCFHVKFYNRQTPTN